MTAVGHQATKDRYRELVRFASVSRLNSARLLRRVCAKTGREQVQQTARLFDHLVGAREQRRGHGEAERIGGREINEEIEFGRLLDREFGWLRSTQNLIDQVGSSAPHVSPVSSIGHQTSRFDRLPYNVHRR